MHRVLLTVWLDAEALGPCLLLPVELAWLCEPFQNSKVTVTIPDPWNEDNEHGSLQTFNRYG